MYRGQQSRGLKIQAVGRMWFYKGEDECTAPNILDFFGRQPPKDNGQAPDKSSRCRGID